MNISESQIPARLHQATWDDFDQSGPAKLVRRWADKYPASWLPPTATMADTGMGMLLHGDPGTGKSVAAAMVIKQVVEFGHSGWFLPSTTLENMLHRQMDISAVLRKDDDLRDETLEAFEQIGLRLDKARMKYFVLCIDDWGRERTGSGQWLQDYVEGLVRERFNRGLPTILTTNLTVDEISARYGKPWLSFMTEAFAFIDFGSRSFRAEG